MRSDTLETFSRSRADLPGRRWYYLRRRASNGEILWTVRYSSRQGRNAAARRIVKKEPTVTLKAPKTPKP